MKNDKDFKNLKVFPDSLIKKTLEINWRGATQFLRERNYDMAVMRFEGKTYTEIAAKYGISPPRVRQILERLIRTAFWVNETVNRALETDTHGEDIKQLAQNATKRLGRYL